MLAAEWDAYTAMFNGEAASSPIPRLFAANPMEAKNNLQSDAERAHRTYSGSSPSLASPRTSQLVQLSSSSSIQGSNTVKGTFKGSERKQNCITVKRLTHCIVRRGEVSKGKYTPPPDEPVAKMFMVFSLWCNSAVQGGIRNKLDYKNKTATVQS